MPAACYCLKLLQGECLSGKHDSARGDKMQVVRWIGCAVIGLVLAGAARAENIKIGIMVPYSGANADLGAVQDKAFDLYMKLHAKDIAPHTVELIKRDEGPPSGANAKTVGNRTHHPR